MNEQEKTWKDDADRLLSGLVFRFDEAARLAATIAQASHDTALAAAAKQALPSLKTAAADRADTFRRSVARRRFAFVRDALARLTQPQFGLRRQPPPESRSLSGSEAERAGRRLLGLPSDGALTADDVNAAFKRLAKSVHPDRGGSPDTFAAVVAARNRLLGRA